MGALCLSFYLGFTEQWVPPGPHADDPGFSAGSDWDRRWLWATVGRAAQLQNELPWWNPFLNYGTPLLSEPESFLLHPVYFTASSLGGARAGLDALYLFSCFFLLGGMVWLAKRLDISPLMGLAAGLVLIVSPEWMNRLGHGHVMVLGLSSWPAMVAALLTATERVERGWRARMLWAGLAGCCLGLAVLSGGHYPVSFGIFLALLLVWAAAAPPRYQAAVAALCALPLLISVGGSVGRYLLEGLLLIVLIVGLLRGRRVRVAAASLLGFALGLSATAGTLLVVASGRARDLGRLSWINLDPPHWDPRRLSEFLNPWDSELESFLKLPHPILWVALLGGLFLFSRRKPELATVGLVFTALAWALGRPLRPWTLVALSPGMMAADSQMRLQWLLLLLGPLGLALGLEVALRKAPLGRARHYVSAAVALAAISGLLHFYELSNTGTSSPPESFPSDFGVVRGLDDPQGVYAHAPISGTLIPEYYSPGNRPLLQQPEGLEGALFWESEGGETRPASSAVSVSGQLATWRIEGPPGVRVVLAQKDDAGWSCQGGTIEPDLQRVEAVDSGPGPSLERIIGGGGWWLSVRLGEAGSALCRWRPPLLGMGAGLQGLAALVLVGLGLGALRASREDLAEPSDSPTSPTEPPSPQ